MRTTPLAGHIALVVEESDRPLFGVRSVTDLVGDALSEAASVVAIPVSRLDPSFFDLRSGFAGEVLQKFANYQMRIAILGDVSAFAARSKAFHDLVVESQRSASFFFVHDLAALSARLSAPDFARPRPSR